MRDRTGELIDELRWQVDEMKRQITAKHVPGNPFEGDTACSHLTRPKPWRCVAWAGDGWAVVDSLGAEVAVGLSWGDAKTIANASYLSDQYIELQKEEEVAEDAAGYEREVG